MATVSFECVFPIHDTPAEAWTASLPSTQGAAFFGAHLAEGSEDPASVAGLPDQHCRFLKTAGENFAYPSHGSRLGGWNIYGHFYLTMFFAGSTAIMR